MIAAVAVGQLIFTAADAWEAAYRWSLFATLAVLAVWMVITVRSSDRFAASLVSLSLLGLVVVHLLWQYLSVFTGLEFTEYVEYDPQTFARNSVIACSGVMMFVAGGLWSGRAPTPVLQPYQRSATLYGAGWAVAALGASMLIVELGRLGLGSIVSLGYFNQDVMARTGGLYAEGFRLLMWGLLLPLAGVDGPADPRRWIVGAAAACSVLLLMLWGYHGFTGAFIVAFYFLWARRVGPVPPGRLAVLVVTLLVLWQITNQVRLIPVQERRVEDYINATQAGDFGWQRSLTEPGLQISVVNRAVSHFPETWEYRRGKDYLLGVLQVVPFVTRVFPDPEWWKYVPTVLSENTVLNSLEILQQQGTVKGVGGSQVAEAYANFGSAGAVVIMFLLGIGMSRLEHHGNVTRDPYTLAYVAMVVQPLLWWIRNHVGDVPRALVWALALVALLRALERGRVRSPRRAHLPAVSNA